MGVFCYHLTMDQISKEATNKLGQLTSMGELDAFESEYLGKKGIFNTLFKSLPSDKKASGSREINLAKKILEAQIIEKRGALLSQSKSDFFDVTIPGNIPHLGNLHLITQAIAQIESIFSSIGFIRRRYPEIESDWYAAEGLNIPKNHPARDDQETFYISSDVVLTAHTSNGQLHEMEAVKTPPIKMINIGKTYRRQLDISHTPMFHQFEGLLIDKNINITHLIGVSNYFVKEYFGPDRHIRLRPHHFQFTEPSFEVDITCGICNGLGCKLCKAGWLELGGAGMVHPTVLKNGKIDPLLYSGFAFGWGIERVIAMKYGIGDIRNLYSTDLRILKQF